MDIKNLGEFAGYCSEHANDLGFEGRVEFAGHVADFADVLERSYGGHGQPMSEFVELALQRIEGGQELDEETYKTMQEVLTRFWKYGEEMGKWFASRIVVVREVRA